MSDAIEMVEGATTFLFVPGDRPDRFVKAFLSGADVVILDLEDAVASDAKADALAHVTAALTTPHTEVPGGTLRAIVRVNADSALLARELAALRDIARHPHHGLLGVMVPKAEAAHQIVEVVSEMAGLAVIPLVETARGVMMVGEIAAVPGVTRLAFGAVDFARDVEATEPAVFDVARAQVVIASRAAGLAAPIDSPSTAIDDTEKVRVEATRSRDFGFGAKMCIHPAQVVAVVSGLAPTPDQIEWATQVVAFEGSATAFAGEMIDKPVVDRAKRILARAKGKGE